MVPSGLLGFPENSALLRFVLYDIVYGYHVDGSKRRLQQLCIIVAISFSPDHPGLDAKQDQGET